MHKITVKDLYAAFAEQMKKGNGNKVVLVADDDEGNGYHPIYFSVTDGSTFDEEDLSCCNTYGISPKDVREKCVIVG